MTEVSGAEAAALLALAGMHPLRLRGYVDERGGVAGAVRAARGSPGYDADRAAAMLARRGTRVWIEDRPGHPIEEPLPDRPAILLAEGAEPECLRRPCVAIVGTRAATPHGLLDARDLAAFLARAGVTVVSGLAIGIDGAAHQGALDAGGPTVGVVATGLDVVYPRRHEILTSAVRSGGLLVGETWFGTQPERWRFPVRNRVIAALADTVVVVEATATGGARITADHALAYGRAVFAMPGSRRNPSAEGCNALLADGALPLLDPSDVLVALGFAAGRRGWAEPPPMPAAGPDAAAVLRALGGEPATPDELVARVGLTPEAVARAVSELAAAGRVERARGCIWPR